MNLEYFPKSLEQDMLTMNINLMDDYMETDIEDIAQIKDEDEVGNPEMFQCGCPCGCSEGSQFGCEDSVYSMDSEAKKFLGLDDVGIQMEYRCSRCRDCLDCRKGEQYEKMSIRQEREQAMIRESIRIDKDQKRAA